MLTVKLIYSDLAFDIICIPASTRMLDLPVRVCAYALECIEILSYEP